MSLQMTIFYTCTPYTYKGASDLNPPAYHIWAIPFFAYPDIRTCYEKLSFSSIPHHHSCSGTFFIEKQKQNMNVVENLRGNLPLPHEWLIQKDFHHIVILFLQSKPKTRSLAINPLKKKWENSMMPTHGWCDWGTLHSWPMTMQILGHDPLKS